MSSQECEYQEKNSLNCGWYGEGEAVLPSVDVLQQPNFDESKKALQVGSRG